jgi:hypothetical protein
MAKASIERRPVFICRRSVLVAGKNVRESLLLYFSSQWTIIACSEYESHEKCDQVEKHGTTFYGAVFSPSWG